MTPPLATCSAITGATAIFDSMKGDRDPKKDKSESDGEMK